MGRGISRMAKKELLGTIRDRCQCSTKRDKGRILDEFTAVTVSPASTPSGYGPKVTTRGNSSLRWRGDASTMKPSVRR